MLVAETEAVREDCLDEAIQIWAMAHTDRWHDQH